jgi:hypothetical protein
MRVSVMRAGLADSTGTKPKAAVPTWKPAGNRACSASQARCCSREVKVSWVLATAG